MVKVNLQFFGGRGANSSGGSGKKLNEKEADAMEWYVSGDGMWINNALRGVGDIKESDLTAEERELVKQLDKVTNAETISEKTLYRTVDAAAIFDGITEQEYQALVNNVVYNDTQKYYEKYVDSALSKMKSSFTDKGYVSTTKDMSIAEDSAYFFGSDMPVMLEIKTGKRTKGIDIQKHASSYMKEVEKYNPQKEVLLSRNNDFNVNKKIGKTKQGFLKISLTM